MVSRRAAARVPTPRYGPPQAGSCFHQTSGGADPRPAPQGRGAARLGLRPRCWSRSSLRGGSPQPGCPKPFAEAHRHFGRRTRPLALDQYFARSINTLTGVPCVRGAQAHAGRNQYMRPRLSRRLAQGDCNGGLSDPYALWPSPNKSVGSCDTGPGVGSRAWPGHIRRAQRRCGQPQLLPSVVVVGLSGASAASGGGTRARAPEAPQTTSPWSHGP